MPSRTNRLRKDLDNEIGKLGDVSMFEVDWEHLRPPGYGMAWAEYSPSRTRHAITNILIEPLENGPARVVEQDDMDNWMQATSAGADTISRGVGVNLSMRVGREHYHEEISGVMGAILSEKNHRIFSERGRELMTKDDWRQIEIGPELYR